MDREEMGSVTSRLMAERESINIITLGSPSGSSGRGGMYYCPTCPHNKLLSKYADTDDKLYCERREAGSGWDAVGCGKIFNIEDFEDEEEPIEQQYCGRRNTKPIIKSQPRKEKQQPGIPDDINYGGLVTYYHEEEYNP